MKKGFSYIFLAALTILLSAVNLSDVSAESIEDIEKKISEFEKEQKLLEEKQGSIGDDKQATEGKIEENINKQKTVIQDINVIDNELTATQSSIQAKEAEIADTNNEIEELNNQITELKDEIKELEKRIEKRDAILKDRLVSMQKNGGSVKYLEVIFGSQSFGDFISRTFAVTTIMDQDKNILKEHQADKDSLEHKQVEIEGKRAEVEEQKIALESQRAELVSLKDQLDKQMAEKESLMAQLEEEYIELEEHKLTLEEEQELLAAEASAIAKAKQLAQSEKSRLEQLAREEAARKKAAEEAARAAKENANQKAPSNQVTPPPVSNGNGMFMWPTPTSNRITSHFNPNRRHPVYGVIRPHNGLDIGAPTGAPVVAAESGVVGRAGWLGTYGNMIMVTHIINGQTYTTVYAHLSSISVSAGQVVSKGDTIGRVGSTGASTGPHLHFEVHPGGYGNPVNPVGYF